MARPEALTQGDTAHDLHAARRQLIRKGAQCLGEGVGQCSQDLGANRFLVNR
jgi:hypothetical protein